MIAANSSHLDPPSSRHESRRCALAPGPRRAAPRVSGCARCGPAREHGEERVAGGGRAVVAAFDGRPVPGLPQECLDQIHPPGVVPLEQALRETLLASGEVVSAAIHAKAQELADALGAWFGTADKVRAVWQTTNLNWRRWADAEMTNFQ